MKQTYKIEANAKINIGLNVLEKREDEYHEIDTLMFPISWYDSIRIEMFQKKGSLSLYCQNKNIPRNKNNILSKIYYAFYEATSLEPQKIKIFLKKRIPLEAGLGGGSADGAFFLKFLNRVYQFPLSQEQEVALATQVGSDLPFFLQNQKARVRGIGEKINPFSMKIDYQVLLIKPFFGYSTKEVYNLCDHLAEKKYSDFESILLHLEKKDYCWLQQNIYNTLEQGLLSEKKELKLWKKKIQKITKKIPFLTGSGSTYCILLSKKEAKKIKYRCQKHLKHCQIKLVSFL